MTVAQWQRADKFDDLSIDILGGDWTAASKGRGWDNWIAKPIGSRVLVFISANKLRKTFRADADHPQARCHPIRRPLGQQFCAYHLPPGGQ